MNYIYEDSCLFCKILKGDIKSKFIANNDYALAIYDAFPLSIGHALVIPKNHRQNILDLESHEVDPIFSLVRSVTDKLQKELQVEAFTIGINHGRLSGQVVDHLHIHIIPRYSGDGGRSIHSIIEK